MWLRVAGAVVAGWVMAPGDPLHPASATRASPAATVPQVGRVEERFDLTGAAGAQPKPAVAGALEDGPLSGAGFSDGPDRGATIRPVG